MFILQGKLINYQVSQCAVAYMFNSGANEGLTDHLNTLTF